MARPWLADSWISRIRESGLRPPPPLACSLVLTSYLALLTLCFRIFKWA